MTQKMFLVQTDVRSDGKILASEELKDLMEEITGVPAKTWQENRSDSGQVLIGEHYMKMFRPFVSAACDMTEEEFIDEIMSDGEIIENITDEIGVGIFPYLALVSPEEK